MTVDLFNFVIDSRGILCYPHKQGKKRCAFVENEVGKNLNPLAYGRDGHLAKVKVAGSNPVFRSKDPG